MMEKELCGNLGKLMPKEGPGENCPGLQNYPVQSVSQKKASLRQ